MNAHRIALALLLTASLAACSKQPTAQTSAQSAAPSSAQPAGQSEAATPATPRDNSAVQQKIEQIAGSGAADCGRVQTLSAQENQAASDCAMKAAHDKKPFHVAYAMPGLTVGVAGNPDGKLFSVSGSDQPSADVTVTPCPAELRVASSGRVTCLPPGSMGMGSSGANPHAGGAAPQGANPHGGGMMQVPAIPKSPPKKQ